MVTTMPDKISKLLENIPAFSLAAQKALKQIDESQTDLLHLARTLESEPSLVAQILRVANSPFYGLSGQIKGIREACMVLGQHTLRNLILAAAVSEVLDNLDNTEDDFVMSWNHCIHTATVARQLAMQLKLDSDASYTAGLLHDIGMLIISAILPEEKEKINKRIAEGVSLLDAESNELGLDHEQLGCAVSKQWNLPDDITEAICSHHTPNENPQALVDITHTANAISEWMREPDRVEEQLLKYIEPESMQRLALSLDTLSELIQHVPTIEEACAERASAA